jgi:LPXTG-motif cell wall-anchored protein
VEKIWDDGAENHTGEAVYVVLYLDNSLLVDGDQTARILRLDAASGWKGTFKVTLADQEDSLSNYDYSIREVDQVRQEFVLEWHPAILENDGTTLLYYDRVVEAGRLFTLNGKGYVVEYGTGDGAALTVTNCRAVELPNTGSAGTFPFYAFGGLLIMAAAFVYGYNRRREKGRGAVE